MGELAVVKETHITIIEEKCVGCGECVKYCPMSVFDVVDRKAIPMEPSICLECGTCIRNCPEAAIMIDGLDEKGIVIKTQTTH